MSETIPTASREQIARHLHRVGQLAAAFSSMLPSGRLPSIEVLTLLHQAAALALQADFQLSAANIPLPSPEVPLGLPSPGSPPVPPTQATPEP